MRSSYALAVPVVAAGAFANAHSNLHHVRAVIGKEPTKPVAGAPSPWGCFSSAPNMTDSKVDTQYLSSQVCNDACLAKKFAVAAIAPNACWCGTKFPPAKDYVGPEKCDYPCKGFGEEACGGYDNTYSVYNTGLVLNPGNYTDDSSSSSSSSSTPSSTATSSSDSNSATSSTSTAVVTETQSQETGKPQKSDGGPNTAAIAAGVVVGVVVAAAIIGAIVFFMRRKRNAEIEEEHRRNAAVNAFISGSKPPSTSGGLSITDERLDPVMAHRRLSDGSIADNQDYSRKILRVTNA